jgi:hypothetical protein
MRTNSKQVVYLNKKRTLTVLEIEELVKFQEEETKINKS